MLAVNCLLIENTNGFVALLSHVSMLEIPSSSMGAGAAMSEGKKMRALTATNARVKISTAINGAMY